MSRAAQKLSMADVVVLGLSPALLVGLIYSLTAFILEVAYRGYYPERLQFVLFCFSVAAVLISRISMTMGRPRALAYAAALAAATLLVLNRLVEVPSDGLLGGFGLLLPYLLVGLIWWVADFLTHDCTHTGSADESGLLDLGLMRKSPAGEEPAAEPDETSGPDPRSWTERYQAEREAEQRRHRPGTWLVIFSLAALPLFALGQAAIPAVDEARRLRAFWLLTLYVGCGLGLLLTTSFLGLRRYLRLRKLEMPPKLTATWLGAGAVLIIVLLLIGTFLPRPAAEYSIPGLLGFATSKQRDADQFAFFNFEGGKKQGQGGGKGEADQNSQQGGGPNAQRDPQAQTREQAEGRQGQGGRGNQGQPQSGGRGNNQGQKGQGQGGRQAGRNEQGEQQSQDPNQQGNQGQRDEQRPGEQGQRPDQNQPRGSAPDQRGDQRNDQGGPRNQRNDSQRAGGEARSERSASASNPPMNFEPPQPPSAALQWLRWLLLLAMAAAMIYALIRYRAELLAWWRSLWERTPGERTASGQGAATAEEEEEAAPPPPFHTFVNPFEQPGRFRSNEEIVRYTFAALESWAYEQNLGRKPDETPHEFMRRLAAYRPRLDQPGKKVVDLYALILYAKAKAPRQKMEDVRVLWSVLPDAGRTGPPVAERAPA